MRVERWCRGLVSGFGVGGGGGGGKLSINTILHH